VDDDLVDATIRVQKYATTYGTQFRLIPRLVTVTKTGELPADSVTRPDPAPIGASTLNVKAAALALLVDSLTHVVPPSGVDWSVTVMEIDGVGT
jgi:hypothetical protein